MKNAFLLLISVLLICTGSKAFSREIPYTQEDRDRLIRTELRLEEFQKQSEIQYQAIQKQFDAIQKQFDGVQKQFDGMQHQFTGLQKQIDTLQNTFFWGIGIMISLIGFLMGFVLWDRRSTLAPLKRETMEISRENQKILDILRKYAEKQPEIREILKNAGML
jgi:hypothetical protein